MIPAHVHELHMRSIVIDGHYDRLYPNIEDARADLEALRAGGVTCHIRQSFVGDVLPFFERTHQLVERWPDEFCIALTDQDIRDAKRSGKIAAILSIEGIEPLGGRLTMLPLLYRLGLRSCGITWNHRNCAADGVMESRSGGGLTQFGVDVVRELDRLGVMVDVAHLAPAAVDDVLEFSSGPVSASHANARSLCDHPRNLTDEHIVGIAQNGGLVGVTPVPKFITEDPSETTLTHFIDHIDHICSLVGPEHVGIASDWDGFESIPNHFMADISDLPLISAALLDRGYTEAPIQQILGGNWLRVFGTATRSAP